MTATNEQVFVNGKIFTARVEEEFVSAFKVTNGKFSWVDDGSEGHGAIDLQGKTFLPDFIDVPTHPTYVAMTLGAVACTPPMVNDIPEMIKALKKYPNHGKGENDWVEGWGYDESKFAEHSTPVSKLRV
jgi:predicted amidohydrolase YtcJ